MSLLPCVRSRTVATDRVRMHCIESGSEDGVPVVLVHGHLSTGRFFEHLMPGAPERYRLIAPDMRGFGDTENVPIDATRGLRDWADDTSRSPATTATRATRRRPSTGRASRPARAGSSTRCRRSTATGPGSSTSIPSRRCCGPTAPRASWSGGRRGSSGSWNPSRRARARARGCRCRPRA
ncbi:MAG: alpha/beta fold hydrolase [Solirubrobacteraceae bacterium]